MTRGRNWLNWSPYIRFLISTLHIHSLHAPHWYASNYYPMSMNLKLHPLIVGYPRTPHLILLIIGRVTS